MQKVIIVIPIHKPDPTKNELASFAQCYKILGKHPVRVVAPEGIDTNAYTKIIPDAEFLFIDKIWLSSIEQYNKLKISLYFYNLFKDYEYLLTYELDAWVFRDELLYWCDKGYDYIGAPWFEGYINPTSYKIVGVGNSGFSLRNVQKSIIILRRIQKMRRLRENWYRFKIQGVIRFEDSDSFMRIFFKVRDLEKANSLILNQKRFKQEDGFWGFIINWAFKDFQVASDKEALNFSIEVHPFYLFSINDSKLPFGCHAWEKYEREFWKDFIQIST